MTPLPLPAIGLRQRERIDGTRYLVAVLDAELVLPAGTELHLVRIDGDAADGPTHALRVFPPTAAPTAAALQRAREDRRDGSAMRQDHRDRLRKSPYPQAPEPAQRTDFKRPAPAPATGETD